MITQTQTDGRPPAGESSEGGFLHNKQGVRLEEHPIVLREQPSLDVSMAGKTKNPRNNPNGSAPIVAKCPATSSGLLLRRTSMTIRSFRGPVLGPPHLPEKVDKLM